MIAQLLLLVCVCGLLACAYTACVWRARPRYDAQRDVHYLAVGAFTGYWLRNSGPG